MHNLWHNQSLIPYRTCTAAIKYHTITSINLAGATHVSISNAKWHVYGSTANLEKKSGQTCVLGSLLLCADNMATPMK